ncbi:MAG: hypothetical protein QXJ74_06160 [Nitrososphaera sp.]
MSAGAPIAFDFQVRGDAEAKNKIQGLGGALSQLDASAGKAAQSAAVVERNYSQAALGLSAAVASGANLYFQFDNLQKVQLRAETATKNVTAAEATLASSRATLNNLTAKGITAGDQFEAATLRLKSAQEQLTIAQQREQIAIGDVSQAQTQFALSILPSVFAGVSGVTSAMKALGITMDLTRLKTLITGPPMLTLAGTLGGTGTAATGASVGLGILRRAMDFVSAHPLLLPMTALATVFTLVATNAFGLRDALDSFGKKVEEVFPAIKPVFDFFRWVAATLFPDAAKEASALQTQYDQQFSAMAKTVEGSAGAQNTALTGLTDTFDQTQKSASNSMANLAASVDVQASNIVASANRARDAIGSIGGLPSGVAPTYEQLTASRGMAATIGGQVPTSIATTPSNIITPSLLSTDEKRSLQKFLDDYESNKARLLALPRTPEIEAQLGGLIDRKNAAELLLAGDTSLRSGRNTQLTAQINNIIQIDGKTIGTNTKQLIMAIT